MNWDNAPEWERDLAKFEQLESIAKSLAKIADALAERHTRREKGKEVCGECGGAKKVIGSYQEGEQTGKIFPVYKPCPSCQLANTN